MDYNYIVDKYSKIIGYVPSEDEIEIISALRKLVKVADIIKRNPNAFVLERMGNEFYINYARITEDEYNIIKEIKRGI